MSGYLKIHAIAGCAVSTTTIAGYALSNVPPLFPESFGWVWWIIAADWLIATVGLLFVQFKRPE